MIYVGVDVAKYTHYAYVMNDKQGIVTSPFPFTNNEAGFEKFLNSFKKFNKDYCLVKSKTVTKGLVENRVRIKLL